MRSLYERRLSPMEAVDAWCGVDDVHQDFIFGNTAIEIKSLSGRDRSTVRISSEDQLETVMDELFLVICRLSERPDAVPALSLNDLITTIERELADADALERFSQKLADFGYVPIPDYDKPRLIVGDRQAFRVEEGFPRLIRSALPVGIARLSYEIEIEAMKGFECQVEELLGGT
jgi:hypothetical protein